MENNTNKKYKFHVSGMHCNACTLLIEGELKDLPNISEVKVSLGNNSLEVIGDFCDKSEQQIAEDLTTFVKSNGYTISLEKQKHNANFSDFKIAIPIALVFILFFIFLQKIGLVNLVNAGNVTYGTAFVVGIIASLSTCMAVVGGLLLSMSATFAKEGSKIKPQIYFHVGRIISFFILGGIIGLLGGVFTLSTNVSFTLSFLVGIIMFILGINLLDIFPVFKRLQPSMPKFISKHVHGISNLNHTFTPFLVGVATFFLPCGFTQSMQLYTLTTGDFLTGGMTMLSFALGTLPVLLLISFSSFSVQKSSKSGIFFKSAGLIVIMFALFNILSSLVVIGIISPLFNF